MNVVFGDPVMWYRWGACLDDISACKWVGAVRRACIWEREKGTDFTVPRDPELRGATALRATLPSLRHRRPVQGAA
jgi:hypothetical protein